MRRQDLKSSRCSESVGILGGGNQPPVMQTAIKNSFLVAIAHGIFMPLAWLASPVFRKSNERVLAQWGQLLTIVVH